MWTEAVNDSFPRQDSNPWPSDSNQLDWCDDFLGRQKWWIQIRATRLVMRETSKGSLPAGKRNKISVRCSRHCTTGVSIELFRPEKLARNLKNLLGPEYFFLPLQVAQCYFVASVCSKQCLLHKSTWSLPAWWCRKRFESPFWSRIKTFPVLVGVVRTFLPSAVVSSNSWFSRNFCSSVLTDVSVRIVYKPEN